ncbi:MAG: hypothetical protein ICV67_07715 [Thermoleophilia bacterium]|nr:hypothetical protein [Thermoleophilia bacterium]
MKKLLLAPLLVLAALALPGTALAGPCGLPDSKPLWIDFSTPDVAHIFGRPGVVTAVSSGDFPARMRAAGAHTIYWDMYLNRRVGTPWAPADADLIEDRAQQLYEIAARQTACATPPIILNELFGAQLETPWTASNEQYRANVLALVRGLAARGARPMLLLSRAPYTSSEQAAQWWRAVAEVSDILPETYFGGRLLWKEGPILANRRMRTAMRNAIGRLTSVGIPTSRIGLVLGFFSRGFAGGREGIAPDENWYRIVKWHARAAREVAGETKIASIVSWGWAPYSQSARDLSDVPATACVYLWARDPGARFCDGLRAAGPRFEADLREGQLVFPGGARCVTNGRRLSAGEVAALSRVTGDPSVAFSIVYGRAAENITRVSPAQVATAERRIVRLRFGGSRGRYLAALREAGANLAVARAALADELRRRQVASTMSGRVPESEIRTFYSSYPDLEVRPVAADPAPWWLGDRPRGLALVGVAPQSVFTMPEGKEAVVLGLDGSYTVTALGETATLGAVPLAQARHAIAAALRIFARRAEFERWTLARQRGLLPLTICRQDVMPQPSTIRVTDFLPFLALD